MRQYKWAQLRDVDTVEHRRQTHVSGVLDMTLWTPRLGSLLWWIVVTRLAAAGISTWTVVEYVHIHSIDWHYAVPFSYHDNFTLHNPLCTYDEVRPSNITEVPFDSDAIAGTPAAQKPHCDEHPFVVDSQFASVKRTWIYSFTHLTVCWNLLAWLSVVLLLLHGVLATVLWCRRSRVSAGIVWRSAFDDVVHTEQHTPGQYLDNPPYRTWTGPSTQIYTRSAATSWRYREQIPSDGSGEQTGFRGHGCCGCLCCFGCGCCGRTSQQSSYLAAVNRLAQLVRLLLQVQLPVAWVVLLGYWAAALENLYHTNPVVSNVWLHLPGLNCMAYTKQSNINMLQVCNDKIRLDFQLHLVMPLLLISILNQIPQLRFSRAAWKCLIGLYVLYMLNYILFSVTTGVSPYQQVDLLHNTPKAIYRMLLLTALFIFLAVLARFGMMHLI